MTLALFSADPNGGQGVGQKTLYFTAVGQKNIIFFQRGWGRIVSKRVEQKNIFSKGWGEKIFFFQRGGAKNNFRIYFSDAVGVMSKGQLSKKTTTLLQNVD